MEPGFDAHRPSSEAERRARLQELAYGSDATPAQRAQAMSALDAIEQEERALIRSRAQGASSEPTEEWELTEAPEDSDEPSSLDRRRPIIVLVALLTAAAVTLTAIGAGLALFF